MKLLKTLADLLLPIIVSIVTTLIFINYDKKCMTFQREIEDTIYHYYDRSSHFIVVSKGILGGDTNPYRMPTLVSVDTAKHDTLKQENKRDK